MRKAATISHAPVKAYHGSVDIPKGSLLAVKDLPLEFILFPVNPADEISQFETERARGFPGVVIRSGRRSKAGLRTWRYPEDHHPPVCIRLRFFFCFHLNKLQNMVGQIESVSQIQ